MTENFRSKILTDAVGLINGDRNNDYGDPVDDFSTTADLWHTYIERTMRARGGLELRAHDVAVMMMLLKIARISWTPTKEDHWVDIAGYDGCGWDCVVRQDDLTEPRCFYCDNGFACDCGQANPEG
jgi:hypothetical protein